MSKKQASDTWILCRLKTAADERIKLVGDIWDSIAEVPEAVRLTDEQRAELDLRLDAYHANPEEGSPWPDVKRRILTRDS